MFNSNSNKGKGCGCVPPCPSSGSSSCPSPCLPPCPPPCPFVAYVFSFTFLAPLSTTALLKAFPRLPLFNGKVLRPGQTTVIDVDNHGSISVSCLGKVSAPTFRQMRAGLWKFCKSLHLSCEYCFNRSVYLLPFSQLASSETRQTKTSHRLTRKKSHHKADLQLRPIASSDVGSLVEVPPSQAIFSPRWQFVLSQNQASQGKIPGLLSTLNQIDFWERETYYYQVIEGERVRTIGFGPHRAGLWCVLPDWEVNAILEKMEKRDEAKQ